MSSITLTVKGRPPGSMPGMGLTKYINMRQLKRKHPPSVIRMMEERKQINADEGLVPYIDKTYVCETCGQTDGLCDPETSECFICGADDWIPSADWIKGESYFQPMANISVGRRSNKTPESYYFDGQGKRKLSKIGATWEAVRGSVYSVTDGHLAFNIKHKLNRLT